MPFTIAVCGKKEFKDRKFVERALNAVHAKRPIATLITGNRPGVEEMAYWWAANKPIPEVVTLPHTGWTSLDNKDRYQRMFTQYQVNGVVVFGHVAFFSWLDSFAAEYQVKIWEVRPE